MLRRSKLNAIIIGHLCMTHFVQSPISRGLNCRNVRACACACVRRKQAIINTRNTHTHTALSMAIVFHMCVVCALRNECDLFRQTITRIRCVCIARTKDPTNIRIHYTAQLLLYQISGRAGVPERESHRQYSISVKLENRIHLRV